MISALMLSSVWKPFSVSTALGILGIIVLLFCSAMASGSEMAYFSFSPGQLHQIKTSKSSSDLRILKLLEEPKRLLATILISNNFVNIAIVILSTYVTQWMLDLSGMVILGFIVQFVIITSLILFFGEILPKILASQQPVRFAAFMSGSLMVVERLFYPLSSILMRSTHFIEKRVEKKGHQISLNELNEVIEIAAESNEQEQEQKILKGIVKFGDLEVKEVMRSRVDIYGIEESTGFDQLLKRILDYGFSRIPVYRETMDTVIGILYIKDLLPYLSQSGDYAWQRLVRQALFIPENMGINDLLLLFREKKVHLAIVVDEFGGTSGLVTLEDIIEEIVGEINDEYDDEPIASTYTKIDDNTYIFEAKTSINDFMKITGCTGELFDSINGEFDSLGGFILEITGKIPARNETIEYKNLVLKIESADNRRIKKVKITIK